MRRSKSRVTIREAAHHTGAATDFPVQSLNYIIGPDASPVLAGEIAVSQRLLNAILHLLGSLFQLHRAQLLHHGFGFLPGRSFAFLGVDRLEHLCHQLYLGTRRDREYIAVKVDGTPLVLGFGEYFSHGLQHTEALVSNDEFHTVQTRPRSHWKKLTQLDLSSFIPSAAPFKKSSNTGLPLKTPKPTI